MNSSGSSQLEQIDDEELKIKAQRVINFFLKLTDRKYLVTRQQIVEYALENTSRNFKRIMDLAIRLLKAVFGFEVHCIEKKYMLINLLRNDNNHLKYSKNEQIESVLLMIVLPTIFMCGDTVEEEKLFTFLKTLDIMNVDDVDLHHHYFGNVKMLLTETFVKQGYLERKLVNKSEEDRRYEYKIGPRALIEISPRKLLQFAVKVDGTLRMEEWTNQYRAVLQAEEEMQQESLEESS